MKRIGFVIAILLILVGSAILRANPSDKPEVAKWEYLAVAGASTTNFSPTNEPDMRKESAPFGREGFVLEQHLDKLGARGWELVSVAGPPNDPVYYFKRRK